MLLNLVPTESRHTRPEGTSFTPLSPSSGTAGLPRRGSGAGGGGCSAAEGPPASAPRWAPTTAPSPSPTPTRLAVHFSSPPAVRTQLRVDLHHVSFQQGQFSHVSRAEVIASDGDAQHFRT